MNYAIVFRLLGYVLMIEGALLLLPAAASLVYGEWMVLGVFLLTAAVSAGIGYALHTIKPRSKVFYMREGFAATSLCWVFISVMGAVPFVLTGCIPNPVDALFETVSGFTTTGASILPAVEGLPNGILFWRSFTHWIGGMGVLVFLLSLLPLTGGSHVNLMKAESPGPQVDKLVPKVQSTAKILYGIYFLLTVLEFMFLIAGRMPVFEALLTSFGTAGTGGFGFRNDSFASMSPYVQWVVTIFMILFGVNFNLYYLLLLKRGTEFLRNTELKVYAGIVLVSVAAITIDILPLYQSFSVSLRQAAFQVTSIMSTTGFITADFTVWSPLSKMVLLMLMFVGGCAGSTAGGLKVSRLTILCKMIRRELRHTLRPRMVDVIKVDGHQLSEQTAHSIVVYFALYMLCVAGLLVALSFSPFDLETNLFASISCFNNVGPGFGMAGPLGNYSPYSPAIKLFLCAGMLLGRLEIYPMLLLFVPAAWRKK